MKLVRFAVGDSKPDFGVVIGDRAAAFADLLRRRGAAQPSLADRKAYLAGLLGSEETARELLTCGEAHLDEPDDTEKPPLRAIRHWQPGFFISTRRFLARLTSEVLGTSGTVSP